MTAPEHYSFTDPEDDSLNASVLSGSPVIELVTETPGVWLSADDAEALAAWLIEAAKALRERSKP